MANTIKQLITNKDNISISSTKFWYNVACFVSTIIVIWLAYNLKLEVLIFLTYMSCTGGFKVASDIIRWRSNINTPEPVTKEEEPAITNPRQLNE